MPTWQQKTTKRKKKEERVILDSSSIFFNAKLLFLMTFWLILIKYSNFLKRNKTEKSFQTSRLRKRPRGWLQVDQKLSELNYVWLISAKLRKFLQLHCKCPANRTLLYYEAAQPNIIPILKVLKSFISHAKRFNISNLPNFYNI